MKDTYISALAKQLVEKTVEKKIAEAVLERLSKKDLKRLLFYLKKELAKKQVYVSSVDKLDSEILQTLQSIFKEKEIVSISDPDLFAGIRIQDNDMIYDFSIKDKIKRTIHLLTQTV
jgi:F0F1-type ATP synthase delta subunit